MKVDLISTYNDMIRNSTVSQSDIDKMELTSSLKATSYFVRPDLRIHQRAGMNGKGELVDGIHIYPDRKCIEEMLTIMQEQINKVLQSETLDNFSRNLGGTIFSFSNLTDIVLRHLII